MSAQPLATRTRSPRIWTASPGRRGCRWPGTPGPRRAAALTASVRARSSVPPRRGRTRTRTANGKAVGRHDRQHRGRVARAQALRVGCPRRSGRPAARRGSARAPRSGPSGPLPCGRRRGPARRRARSRARRRRARAGRGSRRRRASLRRCGGALHEHHRGSSRPLPTASQNSSATWGLRRASSARCGADVDAGRAGPIAGRDRPGDRLAALVDRGQLGGAEALEHRLDLRKAASRSQWPKCTTPRGSAIDPQRGYSVYPGSPGSTIRAVSPSMRTWGWIGRTSRPRACARAHRRWRNAASCSRCLMVGNTSSSSSRAPAASASAGVIPARVDHLAAVDASLGAGRHRGEEEPGVEADLDLGRGDPARERDERRGVAELDAGLLAHLAHRGAAQRRVAVAVVGVNGAAREHPGAAHEPRGRIALDEQDLAANRASPRSRITVAASRGGVGSPGLSSSPGAGRGFSIERTLARRAGCHTGWRAQRPPAPTVATFCPREVDV